MESAADQSRRTDKPVAHRTPKARTPCRKPWPVGYRAYAGSCTWANGVYWLEITGKNNAGQVIARNLSDVGKLEGIEQVETALEPDLLYPLVRGRDVNRWRAQASAYLLNVQDPEERRGYDEDWLKTEHPLTYGYLLRFEKVLRQRSGFRNTFATSTESPSLLFTRFTTSATTRSRLTRYAGAASKDPRAGVAGAARSSGKEESGLFPTTS